MITIVEPDSRWTSEFAAIAVQLREGAQEGVARIDHIGSTSVTGLQAKDVIDVQITVEEEAFLEPVVRMLAARGWRWVPDILVDHSVPGFSPSPAEWRKLFLREPEGERRTNVHIRVHGRANQRYALLFRDYLRAHPDAADAYASVKRGLAALTSDVDSYADAKDPACDLIYFAAEAWSEEIGWEPSKV